MSLDEYFDELRRGGWPVVYWLQRSRQTPDLFAEYRERGFDWAKGRPVEPWEIEPPQYWGWSEPHKVREVPPDVWLY